MLTEVVRQAEDSDIIKVATNIRHCIATQKFTDIRQLLRDAQSDDIQFIDDKSEFIKDFCQNENWHLEDKIVTAFTNKDVEAYNKIIREQHWKDKGVTNPDTFLPHDKVRFKQMYGDELNKRTQNPSSFQNSEEVTIESAKLIKHEFIDIKYWECRVFERNNQNFFRVIDPDSMKNYNDYLENLIILAKNADLSNRGIYWRDYYRLKKHFADVQYIYAATIHKLQGSTYNTAYLDISGLVNNEQISNDFKFRLIYVAITRARNNIKIFY